MSERYLVAVFEEEHDVVAAVEDLRASGYTPADVYTPYPVHALERAMNIPHSRLGWVCAIGGFLGAGAILFFQIWSSSVDWSLNIGGKPFVSLPAFVPVMFEVGVLLAALGTVAAFLFRSRLYPGKVPPPMPFSATDHQFVVLLHEKDASFDAEKVRHVCHAHGASSMREHVWEGA